MSRAKLSETPIQDYIEQLDNPVATPAVRTRTRINTFKIIVVFTPSTVQKYVAVLNGHVTAILDFDTKDASLQLAANTFNSYEGMSKYIKNVTFNTPPILITKSPDIDVVASQSDAYVVEQFVRAYLDRKATKEALRQAQTETENA